MNKEISPMFIGYKGEVKISYERNGKVYESHRHNAGLEGLFKFLCKSLAGKNVAGERPALIDLRGSNDGNVYTSVLSSAVALSGGMYYRDGNEWLYRASATIPASSITVAIDSMDYYRIYLSSRVGQSVVDFAQLQLEQDDIKNITPGTQALVEWVLKFQNLDGSQN